MRAAIYIRVSTDEQAEHGTSIESQKERLLAYCKSQGWDEPRLYIDDGYTGTNLDRPAMKRLLRNIEEKKIDAVIVYKLDRLGRKQKDVLYLLEDEFEKHGVIFKSATEPFDTSTPLGKAMIGILAVFAQLERDMIVERTTTGRRQRVSQGRWYGGPVPFGYEWNKDAQELEVVPEEASIVLEIFKRYLQGQSRSAIADWVRDRSRARTFDHSVIRDILARPIYMGKLANAGSLVDGKHEAIVDPETWYSVQVELERRKDGMSPVGEYLLTGLMECGVCGQGVVHVKRTTRRNGKTYEYQLYACKNQHVRKKDRDLTCSLGYHRREKVEQYVVGRIVALAANPKSMTKELKKVRDHEPDESLIQSLQKELQKANSGLENLYEAIQNGEIKASAVSARISDLEEQREAIERQLEDHLDRQPARKDPGSLFYLMREVANAWELYSEDEQKTLIRKLISKVTLKKDAEPEIEWNLTR